MDADLQNLRNAVRSLCNRSTNFGVAYARDVTVTVSIIATVAATVAITIGAVGRCSVADSEPRRPRATEHRGAREAAAGPASENGSGANGAPITA